MFPSVGDFLDNKYLIREKIAQGGMGAIFKAEDPKGQIVAIKTACFDPVFCDDNRGSVRERLSIEMRVLHPLNHPYIPKIYGQFSFEDNEYLVMEYVEGRTLDEIAFDGRRDGRLLEELRVKGWAMQVLDALEYLHGQNPPIVHRDIKPNNLMLSSDGRVYLIDFGLMKQVRRGMTTAPMIQGIGTEEFSPPEQYVGGEGLSDQRTDIYSLGATLYFLLTNKYPPKAVDRMVPSSIGVSLGIPSIRRVNPTVSRQTERVVKKAMEIDPDARFQKAKDMRNALCRYGILQYLPL